MSEPSCGYCADWNRTHSPAEQRQSCGPCAQCGAPGHVGSHPRQPISVCLCQEHWQQLAASGFRFEVYHLVYVFIAAVAVAVLVSALH